MTLLLLLALQAADPASDIRGWVEELGADDIRRRDLAFRGLLEQGDGVRPFLEEALRGPDPEVRERCRALIRRLEFEPGARQAARLGVDVPYVRPNPEIQEEYEALAAAGKIEELLLKDYRWLTCAVDGLLSDRKPVVVGSIRVLHGICSRRQVLPESALATVVHVHAFRSAQSRADEYALWAQWWYTMAARRAVAEWESGPDPAVENWEETLRLLRGGAGFEDPTTPQYRSFQRVKAMGKGAYSFIIRYIDHEDVAIGNTAVEVLNKLSGMKSPGVTAETKGAVKNDWERWLKTEE